MSRNFFVSVLIALTLFSCSDNDSTENPDASSVFNFDSQEKMSKTNAQIAVLKSQMEEALFEKFLNHVEAEKPTSSNFNQLKTVSQVDNAQLGENLTFYHTNRLEAIYNLRKQLNFTSIQSIADEINSLKFLNPNQAEVLFEKHSAYLKRDLYATTTVFNSDQTELVNPEGKLMLNNVNVATVANNLTAREFAILRPIVATAGNMQVISFGCKVGGTYISGNNYQNLTTYFNNYLYSNVWYNGQYVLYPCFFYTASNSGATYTIYQGGNPSCAYAFGFPAGYGSSLSVGGNYTRPNYIDCDYQVIFGVVGGTFMMPLPNGGYLTLSGSVPI